jgi:hypothetical protein
MKQEQRRPIAGLSDVKFDLPDRVVAVTHPLDLGHRSR